MVEAISLINNSINNNTIGSTQLDINMDNRAYVLTSIDWGAIQSTRKTYKFINQIGVYVTGTTLESRDISIIGYVVGDTYEQLKTRKRFLNQFVNPLQMLSLVYEDYMIDGIPDTTIKYGTDLAENNEVMCKFMIDLFCPDPMFYTRDTREVILADWIPKFHFPLIIPKTKGIIMGLRSQSTIITVNNPGMLETGLTATFYARGTVVNPSITNIATQKKIQFAHTMQPGETLEVTTYTNRKAVRKYIGESSENAFNLIDFESNEFIQLILGENPLRYNADEGISNLEVTIQFKPQYLEVQE